jgi:hypothetical protein
MGLSYQGSAVPNVALTESLNLGLIFYGFRVCNRCSVDNNLTLKLELEIHFVH